MNKDVPRLTRKYVAAFREYLTNGREAMLEEAYELGRVAIGRGLGILDMARIHEEALKHLLRPLLVRGGQEQVLKAKETFFLETLSPFEAAHRGFFETNVKLQERNRELEVEIGERKRTEKALRQSEKHIRELFDQSRRMEENLRNLSNQIVGAQEEERKRVSRELHDEVGQAITAISISIGALKHNSGGSSEAFSQKIADTQAQLRQTMETVRRFAHELRPAMLDELGLLPALRSYLKSFANRTGLQVRFRANSVVEELDADQKTALFRVAQECLTNVAKHARASRVEVELCQLKEAISMRIADNGQSFKEDAVHFAKSKTQLGLLGMQERLRLVNGKFMIKPVLGKGTTLRVEIPFHSEGATMLARQEGAGAATRKIRSAHAKKPDPGTLTRNRSHYGKNQSVAGG